MYPEPYPGRIRCGCRLPRCRDGAFFSHCPDYTLFVLPRSGHCHNFASTRRAL